MKRICLQIINESFNGISRLMAFGAGEQAVSVNRSFPTTLNLSWTGFLKKQMFVGVLTLSLLFSAFGIIYVKDVNRRLMGNLQALQTTSATLHNQWSQFLLEKSTWDNQARIQSLAEHQLGMITPKLQSIIMLSAGS